MTQAIHTLVGRPTNSNGVSQGSAGRGEWLRWVRHDETGAGQYSDYPSGGTIDLDNDGEIKPAFRCIADLSHGLSQVLGKQLNMTSVYRVVGIQIGIRPVDDLNDNNQASMGQFGGRVKMITPTKHRVDAIQAARQLEKMVNQDNIEKGSTTDVSPSIFGVAEKSYQGFRFGYRTEVDVLYPNTEEFTGVGSAVEGGASSWCLFDDDGALGIMSSYNEYIDGEDNSKSRALWDNRIGRFTATGIPWMAAWNNDEVSTPVQGDWYWQAPAGTHIDCLGGLLLFDVNFSPVEAGGFVDDDYYLEIGIQVAGWSDF